MGMSVGAAGGKARITPQMNVTPLVDVVLVLLIIFMVVTPLLTKQFWLHVPKKDDAPSEPRPDDEPPLVLSMAADGSLRVNREAITVEELAVRLPRMFAARGDHVLVFDAAGGAPYGKAVGAMDHARAAGAVTIVVSPTELP